MIETKRTARRLSTLGLVLILGACTTYAGPPGQGQGQGQGHAPGPAQVPPGHMPPPGECRIWYPNTPPGHQPPPGPCAQLQHQVPPGAYLIRG